MLTSSISALEVEWIGPDIIDSNMVESEGFEVPNNATVSAATLEISPEFPVNSDNGTHFGWDVGSGFTTGVFNQTSIVSKHGKLSLSQDSTIGQLTDFENLRQEFNNWSSGGPNASLWSVVFPGGNGLPPNVTEGNWMAGTSRIGAIDAGVEATLTSPEWQLGNTVRNLTIEWDQWIDLDANDEFWLEFSTDSGANWSNATNTWGGSDKTWQEQNITLDGLIAKDANSLRLRYHIITDENSNPGAGVFLDDIQIHNQGHPPGAWFHGNLSGDYAPSADGRLIIPINLTGITDPAILEYDIDWDLAGGWNDNIIVALSEDGGANWAPITPIPGIPGTNYGDESFGFTTLSDPLPPNLGSHPNASSILLMFQVYTDSTLNYGGSSSSGWEGVFLDDIAVRNLPPNGNGSRVVLQNFTTPVGQLSNLSGYANEWVWVNHTGKDGPRSFHTGFEDYRLLPAGWSVNTENGNGWKVGTTSNVSGFGPGTWTSGSSGAAIGLNGAYSALTTTHLVSPSYNIPQGATASVVFNHWICTEADWDGGAIFLSTDDGLTWWHHGDSQTGFYDRISATNTASPLYGLGIFDGSNVPGGCGMQNFEHKRTDISNLSGESVRVRFTFFSDDFVQEDGWYIDDAGIAVDIHENSGTWMSPLVEADMYGWSLVDVAADVPNATSLSIDVLAEDGLLLHHNQSFPLDLLIDAQQHPRLYFRLNMSTTESLLTPVVERLHIGQVRYLRPGFNNTWDWYDWTLENGNYTYTGLEDLWISQYSIGDPLIGMEVRCNCSGINISAGWISNPSTSARSLWNPPPPANYSFVSDGIWEVEFNEPLDSIWYTVGIDSGATLNSLDIELHRFIPAKNISIDVGQDDANDFEWFDNSTIDGFGITNSCSKVFVDGIEVQTDAKSLVVTAQSNITCSMVVMYEGAFTGNGGMGSFASHYTNASQVYFSQSRFTQPVHSSQGRIQIPTRLIAGDNAGFIQSGMHEIPGIHGTVTMTTYELTWNSSNPFTLNLFDINWVWDAMIEAKISQNIVEDWLASSDEYDHDFLVNLSMFIEQGEITVDGNIEYDYDVVDEWISLPSETIIPGRVVSAQSKHYLGSQGAQIDKIRLSISGYDNPQNVIAIIEVDRLDEGGRFIHHNGTGSIFSNGSQVSVVDGDVQVNWSLEGGWHLDDYPRLRWNVMAINQDGISLGPATGISGGPSYAASTNDLEVHTMTILDPEGRVMSDWTNTLYPLHIMSGEPLSISGDVRFSGVVADIEQHGVSVRVLIEDSNGTELTHTISPVSLSGSFITMLEIPVGLNSGDELRIRSIIENCGSLEHSPDSCIDQTSSTLYTEFIIDDIASEAIELWANTPAGQQYADGHIAPPDSNIALTLHIKDADGLGERLTMHTWKQKIDDDGDGSPEPNEYQERVILLPTGQNESWIDLPLIDPAEIIDPEEGYLSVWFSGVDLAGNPIENAGSPGENDLARIRVMQRYASFVDTEKFEIDRNEFLPGQEHSIQFELTDANGISSLDAIKLDLTGSSDGNTCQIIWQPWSDAVSADTSCFIGWPRISTTKHDLAETWDVKFHFRLRWDVGEFLTDNQHRPSIIVEDEGNNVGLGLNSIPSLEWSLNDDVEVSISSIEDLKTPIGTFVDDTLYASTGDEVEISLQLLHKGSEIPVEHIADEVKFYLTYSDMTYDKPSDDNGVAKFDLTLNKSEPTIFISAQGFVGSVLPFVLEVVEDSTPPSLSLAPGSLAQLRSDMISAVMVNVHVNDAGGWGAQTLDMHWSFQRQGSIIFHGQTLLPLSGAGSDTWSFAGTLNMTPTDASLQAGDHLFIWFSGTDLAGLELAGQGSENQPFTPEFWWMEFDPGFATINANPYRPVVGDEITIDVGVINRGLVQGNLVVELRDSDGKLHSSKEVALSSSGVKNVTFELEAWKQGDLGLVLSIPGYMEDVPVPLDDVRDNSDSSKGMSSMQMAGLFFLIASMTGLLLVLNARSKNLEKHHWYEEE